jgi:hypothetical protein
MEHYDEADEDADGTPQQVGGAKAEDHVLLTIDGARPAHTPKKVLDI